MDRTRRLFAVEDFIALVAAVLPDRNPNARQRECIAHTPEAPLMIIAGPGTGKTTVLVMRALRILLVDRVLPEQILITTFTKKAAREIRTRLIDWGLPLINALMDSAVDAEFVAFLRSIDINRFLTGTLDSICEDALADSREPTERPPVVVEPFSANQILSRIGRIREERDALGGALESYLHRYSGGQFPPTSVGEMTRIVRVLVDRFVQDHVDLAAYASVGHDLEAKAAIVRIFQRYESELRESNRMDFAMLERAVLERFAGGRGPDLLLRIRTVLIDEYQDTNPLQESLYFALVSTTGASLTVVGDDDQSLYRFRGATIELFREFASRVHERIGGEDVRTLPLIDNYRSRPEITTFFNNFIENDAEFAPARVQPLKARIETTRNSVGLPVLGMFRSSAQFLATDLAAMLHDIFRGGGWTNPGMPGMIISADPTAGDFGDAVLIGHSVAELGNAAFGNIPAPRLPLLLRAELAQRGVATFNPRGRALRDVPNVCTLLGIVLESLDPSNAQNPGGRAETLFLTSDAKRTFREWRAAAATFLASTPRFRGVGPDEQIARWRRIVQTGIGEGTAREWPVLDVIYGFIPWLPEFQDDPEHQVYLEAISRGAAEAATFSSYRATIVAQGDQRDRSVNAILFDVLQPIADGLIDPDEDIMPSVPRNRLNVMTIHQAKGLEYPLVIVDISSRFAIDSKAQRFQRFPEEPSPVALLEDDLAHCTEIGQSRMERSALARSFDDLIRLYYVAYSRPQSVLLLVGHQATLKFANAPKNVARLLAAGRNVAMAG